MRSSPVPHALIRAISSPARLVQNSISLICSQGVAYLFASSSNGNLAILHMLDYANGINALRYIPAQRSVGTGGLYLRDLGSRLLAQASHQILHQGPARSYITRELALPPFVGACCAIGN